MGGGGDIVRKTGLEKRSYVCSKRRNLLDPGFLNLQAQLSCVQTCDNGCVNLRFHYHDCVNETIGLRKLVGAALVPKIACHFSDVKIEI